MKIDTLTAQLDSFHNLLIRKDSLLSQCQERSNLLLSKWDTEQLRRQGLSNPVDDLKSDLISNKEIIQEEGVLGGEMQFYSKDKIYVLNDKWVLAYYEDGHNAGSMLLAYNVGKGGTINWDVIRATSM